MSRRIRFLLPVFTLVASLFTLQPVQAATIQLPQTGQTLCYPAGGGTAIACNGTGQSGDKPKGAAWPVPRFTVNKKADNVTLDGTVTDNLTGLIWLTNANCLDTVGGIVKGTTTPAGSLNGVDALTWSNSLSSGYCGLNDGSVAGDWRLPNITELKSLVDLSNSSPALPSGHPFTSVQNTSYWSSSTGTDFTYSLWFVVMSTGVVFYDNRGLFSFYAWPVRGGQ